MALQQNESPTVTAIYKAYEAREAKVAPRGHLGASLIGHACARFLWLQFRWCADRGRFPGRVLRLFETGHKEEARVFANLRAIGCTVHEVDPKTGRQFRYMLHGGHFGGSLDGVVIGIVEAPKTWHLAECKTSNAKGFAELERHGVKKAKSQHWQQVQTYLGFSGLTRALYVAVCKDTDAIYIERIKAEPEVYQANVNKALRIIQSAEPLTKISDNPESLDCRWCDFKGLCHDNKVPPAHCRTCAHATPLTDGDGGRWHCARHDKLLTNDEQLRGCDEHLYIPAVVPYAKPVDAGDGWVAYKLDDRDQTFINCAATAFPAKDMPHYSSQQLATLAPEAIGREAQDADAV